MLITLTTDFGKQSHGVGMMEAVIAEIAPQARVIHYMHGIEDYDTMSAAHVLETVQFILPAIHVCICDPGVGTVRRPLAILTHRGDIIIIGPDNGVLLPAVVALGGAVEMREISNPAVMRRPISAVFHGRDVFCPAAAQLANGLRFELVGEPVDPATLARRPSPMPPERKAGGWLGSSTAAVSRYASKFRSLEDLLELLDFDDERTTLTQLAQFALAGLAAEADLFRLLQRDGPDFPDLTMLVHEQLVQRGYDFAIAVFTRLLQARGLPVGDVAALAAIALGSLVHFREDEALYRKTPADATEEQFVATWVDTWLRVLENRTAEAKRRAV